MAYMTPGVPPEGTPAPAAGTDPATTAANLEAYVEANAGRFTDAAITDVLSRAGYDPENIRTALAAARARHRSRPAARARRAILAAYAVVFLALSAGMLLHGGAPGELIPNSSGGIAILAVSLLVALGLSGVWLASRRAFAIIVLVVIALPTVSFFGVGGAGPILGAVIELACLAGIVLLLRRKAVGGPAETALGVLLAIPVVLLLVVAGICVGSGLPIPGGA